MLTVTKLAHRPRVDIEGMDVKQLKSRMLKWC